ncbi:MAG: hypothetical protein ABR915_23385 [Thermoguttaceae bacterium]|jgi:hypothetical protein
MKVKRAIEILQLVGVQFEIFSDQFALLLRVLAEWINDHRDAILAAYLTGRDGALVFVIVRNRCEFDDAFEDLVSDLDFRVANDSDLGFIRMDAIALPLASQAAVASFIDPRFVLEFSGDGIRNRSYSPGQQEP